MSKTFRPWDVDQMWMLPPTVHELVPAGHLAHLIRDTVRESLDLSEILGAYDEERGYPPYHPAMMTCLLLYAYCQGIYSSRRIARACQERVDFMAVTALQRPDFRTVSDFRKRHLSALGDLFGQVLALCQRAGLVRLGHVALDGTRVKANASKHKAMSYGRMKSAEARLSAEVQRWFAEAARSDTREDREHGADRSGDEMPAWVADKQQRLQRIREARAALEAQARTEAESPGPPGGSRSGRGRQTPPGVPPEDAQRNFTDPESRIMKTKDGFIQGYNAQAAVDAESQVIVARGLTAVGTDVGQLGSLVRQIRQNTGRQARELSADAGYCSEENLKELNRRHIRAYVATGRQKHGVSSATGRQTKLGPRTMAMRTRLRCGGYRSRYRLRKQTVEPVFGQIKQARGFRQFLLRGVEKVGREWDLICTAHNLLKWAAAVG
ncbi:IS1182 family transposase [Patescibacteria group bacterium]|nr:IS1182 family transposase [Patescibacteria group bacterium]